MAGFDPINNNSLVPVPSILELGPPDPNLSPYDPLTLAMAFNRAWLVSFSLPLAASVPGPPSPIPPVGPAYNSLRTVFEIEKTASSTANKGKISIYGLDDLSRANYVKGVRMSLAVGYGGVGGLILPIFSNAAINRVVHERKGADIISHFESGEGESEIKDSIFFGTFPAMTPVGTIISAVIATMGLALGPSVGYDPTKPYQSATTWSDSGKKILDTIIVKELGLRWWVSGAILQISAPGLPTNPAIVYVSQSTGLIGVPNVGMGQGGDNVMTFTSLISPFLNIGTAVTVRSQALLGSGIIKLAKFKGDTHGNDWTVTCECTPIVPAASSALSTIV